MATFESAFGLGDHVWIVIGPCSWDGGRWHIYEAAVDEVQFTACSCGRIWYRLRYFEDLYRESALFGTLEDAVNSLPKKAKYLLYRADGEGKRIDEGAEGETNCP